MSVPILLGPDGKPITKADGGLLPHYTGFASIVQAVSRTYSYRYDEAKRDSRVNALAMNNDVYLRSLRQERKKSVEKLEVEVDVPNPKDPVQKTVRDGVKASLDATWRWRRLMSNLLEAEWYGRYGVQVQWSRDQQGRWHISHHRPVNGDKIMFGFDGTPAVLLHTGSIPEAYKDSIISTDAGGRALKLDRPEYRRQFVIHQHDVEDADFFEGERAGAVHGIGLRSWCYWSYWMKMEMLDWMVGFMEGVGMMDLLVFNYAAGNPRAKEAAEANAKRVSGKVAFTMPRGDLEKYPLVEQIPMNVAGVATLKDLIESFFERHLERLMVGQSMSSGGGGAGGLEGDGRAMFGRDTKFQIVESSADNLAETITQDIVKPLLEWQYPYADFPVKARFAVPDPEVADKLRVGIELAQAGARVKEEDLLELAGFVAAGPNDAVLGGGRTSTPGGPGADPSLVQQVLDQQRPDDDPEDNFK